MRHAKKSLGQNFLIDLNIIRKIVNLIEIKNKNVIEIGPGKGALTNLILQKKPKFLTLVEKDDILFQDLKLKYKNINNLRIINKDILKFNFEKNLKNNTVIFGNLPYNIASQILTQILRLKWPSKYSDLIFMFQKEVGERIIATKGKKKGILSVLIQTYYNVEYCLTLNEQVFHPPPKVKSAVLRFSRNNRLTLKNEMLFFQIVKSGFNQRRKILKNALKTFDILESEKTNYLLNLRAEELTIEDFINITKNVRKNKN